MSQSTLSDLWYLCNNQTGARIDQVEGKLLAQILKSFPQGELGFWFAWKPGWGDWEPVLDLKELRNLLNIDTSAVIKVPEPPQVAKLQGSVHDQKSNDLVADENEANAEPVEFAEEIIVDSDGTEDSIEVMEVTGELELSEEPSQEIQLADDLSGELSSWGAHQPPQEPIIEPEEDEVVKKPDFSGDDRRAHPRHDYDLKVILVFGQASFRSFTKNISLGGAGLKHVLPNRIEGEECRVFISRRDQSETVQCEGKLVQGPGTPGRIQFINSSEEFQNRLTQWLEGLESSGRAAS